MERKPNSRDNFLKPHPNPPSFAGVNSQWSLFMVCGGFGSAPCYPCLACCGSVGELHKLPSILIPPNARRLCTALTIKLLAEMSRTEPSEYLRPHA
ncbi:hypothetical protein V2G26_017440 [Clonostachys chloroleuca]